MLNNNTPTALLESRLVTQQDDNIASMDARNMSSASPTGHSDTVTNDLSVDAQLESNSTVFDADGFVVISEPSASSLSESSGFANNSEISELVQAELYGQKCDDLESL